MPIDTKDLGLPIEYKMLPQFFDSHNINDDTDKKIRWLKVYLKNTTYTLFMI